MPRRVPRQEARHLAARLALLADALPALLEAISINPAFSRIHIHDLFSPDWGLSVTGSQGSPYTLYEGLKGLRRFLIRQQKSVKPIQLHFWSEQEDARLQRCATELKQRNETAALAQLNFHQYQPNRFSAQFLQRSKAADKRERHLLLADPAGLSQLKPEELSRLCEKQAADLLLFLPVEAFWNTFQKKPKPLNPAYEALIQQYAPALSDKFWEESPDLKAVGSWLGNELAEGFLFSIYLPSEDQAYAIYLISSDAWLSERLLQHMQEQQARQRTGDQMGLFADNQNLKPTIPEAQVLQLFQHEEVLSNADLYVRSLQQNLLPAQVQLILSRLIQSGHVQVVNEKGKPVADQSPLPPLNFTAYKLPKPSGYYRKA